ncbi:hypothetical protein SAMN05421809_3576 [Natronorubrum daqingense]|uniref:Uncharacterized protein n=1 Tax=Natronorubrum daqingense TaxID=588898 RepID=A0A1N7FYE1_9EURY|nr:hypothetical protein SAMN05421809_3576 [Natronorubrum daqingense]
MTEATQSEVEEAIILAEREIDKEDPCEIPTIA